MISDSKNIEVSEIPTMTKGMNLRSKSRSDEEDRCPSEEAIPTSGIDQNSSCEGRNDVSRNHRYINGDSTDSPTGPNSQNDSRIPESYSRLRPMPTLPLMESPLNMDVPSLVEVQRMEAEAMRKDFERSIERVRAESEMIVQEYREEMKRGLNVVHDHIHRLDKLSRQERAENAISLKELTKTVQRDLNDQATYQYQCQQATEE